MVYFELLKYFFDKKTYIKNSVLNIPENVKNIKENDFSNLNIEKVYMPDTIENIGKKSFFNNKISILRLSKNLETIPESAFSRNKIDTLFLPNILKTIEDNAFFSNELETISFPYKLLEIGANAFANNKIKEVEFQEELRKIGDNAFANNSIFELELNFNLESIGKEAFILNNIETIKLSENLSFIGEKAFFKNKINKLEIPSNLCLIGNSAFCDNKIENITFSEGLMLINDEVFFKNKIKELKLPNTIIKIGKKAFAINKISNLKLSNNLKEIGDLAFYRNEIQELIIPNSVKTIGIEAFNKNPIHSLKLSNNLKEIKEKAFYENNIEFLELPESLEKIGEEAFSRNDFSEINIPKKIKKIETNSFSHCDNLKILFYKDKKYEFQEGINHVIYKNDLLVVITNKYTNIILFDKEGNKLNFDKKQIFEFIDDEDIKEKIELNYNLYKDWEKIYTSKDNKVDYNTLNNLGTDIIFNIKPTKENANMIKQGLKDYNLLKQKLNFSSDVNSNLFKMCFSLGFFDGNVENAKKIKEKINFYFEKNLFNKLKVNNIFSKIDLDEKYSKEKADLMIKAYENNDISFVNIHRIYNEFDYIKKYIKKAYSINIKNIKPRIEILLNIEKLDKDQEKSLKNLKESLLFFENGKNKINISELSFYFENNVFSIREGNEDLYNITTYLTGLSQKDFDEIQNWYEESKNVKKELVQTKDMVEEGYSYQWSKSDNPINIILGYIVDCCARKNGAGEDIMKQSMVNPCVQNLLIRDFQSNIVAKSTAYYNKKEKYIVFNNVEISESFEKKSEVEKQKVRDAIKRAIEDQLKYNDLEEIRMGMKKNDLYKKGDIEVTTSDLLENYEYNEYFGDANDIYKGQGILYNKQKIKKLN